MIKSFKHKGLEKFYTTGSTKGIQANHKEKLSLILVALNRAKFIDDLSIPAFRSYQLKGNLSNLWSIIVQANWRITFEFDKETQNVYIVDY